MTNGGRTRWRAPGGTAAPQDTLALALAAALFLYGAYSAFSFPTHHDMAWLLYAAGRALDGAELYVDVVEIDPPLIIFLSMAAELVARVTGLWDIAVVRLLVLGLAAVSLMLAATLLRTILGAERRLARHVVLLVLVLSLVGLPGMQFGQREHLAVLLTLPYLLAVAARAGGGGVGGAGRRVAIGAMAGVGFALKPFFLLVWLPLEAFLAWRRGPRSLVRAEQVAVLSVFAAYAAATLILTPAFPEFAQRAYGAYAAYSGANRWALLTLPGARLAGIALAAALLVPAPASSRPLRWALGLGCAGFFAGVLLQSKGWAYHWLPVYALAGPLLAATAVDVPRLLARAAGRVALFERVTQPAHAVALDAQAPAAADARAAPSARVRRAAPTLVLVGLALILFHSARVQLGSSAEYWDRMSRTAYRLPEMIQLVETHAHGGPIATLSTNMQAAFPLVNYTGVDWGLRFNSLFLLPGLYAPTAPGTREFAYRRPGEMLETERYIFDATIADLERSRPTLLIIDTLAPGYVLHGFDYIEYFSQDARFRTLLESYRPLAVIDRYRVLQRVEGA